METIKKNNVSQDAKPTFKNLQVEQMQIFDIEQHSMMTRDKNTQEKFNLNLLIRLARSLLMLLIQNNNKTSRQNDFTSQFTRFSYSDIEAEIISHLHNYIFRNKL